MTYWGYCQDDIIPCMVCDRIAVDIHHISSRGLGGDKCKDYEENLISLCRSCHEEAHKNKEFNKSLKLILLKQILIKLMQ